MLGNLFSRWRGSKSWDARLPDGMRVYAVGDIHGRLDLLRGLHERIAEDAAGAPDQAKTIVYLGDYIDRGLESRGVIDLLLDEPLADVSPVHLLGNHEEAMLHFLDDSQAAAAWLQFGGDATLYSYGVQFSGLLSEARTLIDAQLDLREKLPENHLAFLRGLETHYRAGDFYFVHAGVRPGVALEDQTTQDLIWIRDEFLRSNADHGVVVVHGHSITPTVEDLANRISIDTGAYATNILTCLVLEGGDHRLLQTE